MNNIRYHIELGVMVDCTKNMMEARNGLGQRDLKWATKDYFLFGSWFFSKRLEEDAMDVGADIVGMVETNTKI